MTLKYVHFTDLKGAEAILDSGMLWQSSYGPAGAVFAVVEGGHWVPNVQLSSLGRAKNRTVALVFTTQHLPDYAMPEEVMWHMDNLPIDVVDIIDLNEAKSLLNGTLKETGLFEFLNIPLHPAFNDFGDWARMPENFTPWMPGKDDEKYNKARKIWLNTKDIQAVEKFWFNKNSNETLVAEVKAMVHIAVMSMFNK